MILLKEEKSKIFSEKDKIKCSKKKKIEILDIKIKEYEQTVNFEYIECPRCHSNKLISYGTYKRNIVICDSAKVIKIKRVRCKECGHSHALIPSFIKPFFVFESSFIDYNIMLIKVRKKKKREIEYYLNISRQIIRKWIIRFNKHKNYISTTFSVCIIRDIVHQIFQEDFNKTYICKNCMRYFS